jgi:hypothetical protein
MALINNVLKTKANGDWRGHVIRITRIIICQPIAVFPQAFIYRLQQTSFGGIVMRRGENKYKERLTGADS